VTPETPLWFINRSTGEVTLVLLSAVVILGVYRSAYPRTAPALVIALHRNLSLAALVLAVAHAFAAVLDPFAGIRVIDAVVPFLSSYRPLYLGLGTLSGLLFLVAIGSPQITRRLRRGTWLWIHRLGYLSWGAAVVHAIGTGTDTRQVVFLTLDVVSVAAVVGTVGVWRLAEGQAAPPLVRISGAVGLVLAAALLIAWTATGPLQPGWARSAGTPPGLLAPNGQPKP
jgi:methionine sulfoxide reductase heme-binding subunit